MLLYMLVAAVLTFGQAIYSRNRSSKSQIRSPAR